MKDKYWKVIIWNIISKASLAVAFFVTLFVGIILIKLKESINQISGIAVEMYITSIPIVCAILFMWGKSILSDEQDSICTVFSIMWLTIPAGFIIEIFLKLDTWSYELWIYCIPIIASILALIYGYVFCYKKRIKLKQIVDCAVAFCGSYVFLVNLYYDVFSTTEVKRGVPDIIDYFVTFSLVIISSTKILDYWKNHNEIKICGKSTTIVKRNIRNVEKSVPENSLQLSRKWIRLVFWMRMPLVLKTIDCDYDENDKSTNKKLYTDWIITHEKSFKKLCDDTKYTIYKLAECLWNINSSLTIKSEIRGKNDTSLRIDSKMENIFYGKIKISVKELIEVLYEEAKIELDEKEKIVTPWKKFIEK